MVVALWAPTYSLVSLDGTDRVAARARGWLSGRSYLTDGRRLIRLFAQEGAATLLAEDCKSLELFAVPASELEALGFSPVEAAGGAGAARS